MGFYCRSSSQVADAPISHYSIWDGVVGRPCRVGFVGVFVK